jgi:hypothetical protein
MQGVADVPLGRCLQKVVRNLQNVSTSTDAVQEQTKGVW